MPDVPSPLETALAEALDGRTVEQVSAETRIRATLIRDLAAGRTDTSGGDVYARGHLKAIAHATGADAAALLTAYERTAGTGPPAPVEVDPVHLTGQRAGSLALPLADKPERRGPRWGVAVLGAAAVLLGLVVVGNVVSGPEPAQGRAAPSPSAPVSAEPTATAPRPAPTRAAPTGAALQVRIAGGASWVQVKSAGRTVFEGILADGTTRSFSDPEALAVRVGNAGAVSLVCGGKGAPAGDPGQVRSFSCAKNGLAAV